MVLVIQIASEHAYTWMETIDPFSGHWPCFITCSMDLVQYNTTDDASYFAVFLVQEYQQMLKFSFGTSLMMLPFFQIAATQIFST